jgi:hypothetical protein
VVGLEKIVGSKFGQVMEGLRVAVGRMREVAEVS